MDKTISANLNRIKYFFESNRVEKAYVFGSAVSGGLGEHSDIDFLIKFKEGLKPEVKGELWWNLHDALRDFFNREIDIVTEDSLKNPYFIKELDKTKQLIYG